MNQCTVWILDSGGWHPVIQTDLPMANRIARRYHEIGVECMVEESPAVVIHTETSFEELRSPGHA